jgi:para-aminobenzoate synthetase
MRTPGYLDVMPVASQTEVSPLASAQPLVRRLDRLYDAERAFISLYGASPNSFWLDSSAAGGQRGRFSFIGDSQGPAGASIAYDVNLGEVRVERGAEVEIRQESIFDYLDRELQLLGDAASDLPFDFGCGFAGYFGYELKVDCGADASRQAATPDAAFVFADRLIAFDHWERCTYVVSLAEPDDAAAAMAWLEQTARRLESLPALEPPQLARGPLDLRLRRPRERYEEDIAACQRYLTAGHSYEICLTNRLIAETASEPLELYRALRRANPAPFAAYLRFGDLSVLSSSPERFLAVDRDGWAEARPIKGTSRRGAKPSEDARLAAALRSDEKSRAENVTIVDLLRNDLGRVCEVGTVSVPELMQVETYETVHQLVSSVRGRLRPEVGVAQCVRACFPPGSMTGAPKLRTMEILDQLEGEARGVYSGAIGYLGIGGGCDLSVAIRAIVLERGQASIGAGGAIVVDSVPAAEFEEMLLKAAALGPGAAISSAAPTAPGQSRRRYPSQPTS